MNPEQAKSSVRWAVATFGGGIAGFAAGKGWASADTVMALLNSEMFTSAAVAAVPLIWGLFTHTQSNAVAVVDAIAKDPASPVKGVVVENTAAGRDLAKEMPGSTTVVAGTFDAKQIATPGKAGE
jgi:hypothetical protein